MPASADFSTRWPGVAPEIIQNTASVIGRQIAGRFPTLERRVNIPCCNSSSPPGLVEASTVDPWSSSGKYALGWVYFSVLLLAFTIGARWYHFWNDKIRTAVHKENNTAKSAKYPFSASSDTDYELSALATDKSTRKFFPRDGPLSTRPEQELATASSSRLLSTAIALTRYVFYHPLPAFRIKKGWKPIVFPSIGVVAIVFAALAFVLCYCFIPQPLYWQSIAFGSPPLAVRAGMIAIAMMPWIVALSMKANIISIMTGLGHERLNVLHRWLAYICLLLSLIHTIPYYITPIWDNGGMATFQSFFANSGVYVYGTGEQRTLVNTFDQLLTHPGIAALVPLIFLCVHSLPVIRHRFYELFVMVHVPVSIVLLGMLFWHCNNYLTSWSYLWATLAIWLGSYALRLLYLNWSNPFRISWLIGEEAAVTLLPENAIKVTIPTQMRWKPGQYVYLRIPGISIFENHPFTIASLCSDDFPSGYGEDYRDMVLVFRPFGGFTNKVLETALEYGPWHTYRAFLDGPYGAMPRSMDSFDHVVLFAGGSGVTAIVSQLLDLIKRMRDGKAVTQTVHVVWAMKRKENLEWFQEELRICREFAPPDAVTCQFFITQAKRLTQTSVTATTPTRPKSMILHDKVNDMFQNIASNRYSMHSNNRYSELIQAEANGDPERELELLEERTDRLRPLPQAHLRPAHGLSRTPHESSNGVGDQMATRETPHLPPHPTLHEKRRSTNLSLDLEAAHEVQASQLQQHHDGETPDFGFPSTPTDFQRNLMRFAFMPAAVRSRKTGWSTEWGRPDVPFMLREMSREWTGKRVCVFVCGPPTLRVDVTNTVADLQRTVWTTQGREEIFLHAENYAL
nr:ferric/cupric reductase transmembrane component 7 [Quercus suber]